MAQPKVREPGDVHGAREDYFAGKISTDEYLRRALPSAEHEHEHEHEQEHEHRLADQFRRILDRLRKHSR